MTEMTTPPIEPTEQVNTAPLSPEVRLTIAKAGLIEELHRYYFSLSNFIIGIPFSDKLKEHCLMNLDQGLFWAKQGINIMQFEVTDPPKENDNAESTQETKTGEEIPCQENACQEGEVLNEKPLNQESESIKESCEGEKASQEGG